jgi:hypothetical protein
MNTDNCFVFSSVFICVYLWLNFFFANRQRVLNALSNSTLASASLRLCGGYIKQKPAGVSGGRRLSNLGNTRSGKRAPRMGMVVMMMPMRAKSCHKPAV